MVTIAEFLVPPEAFPLGRLFETLPDVTVELDRVVPTNESIFPYFWVERADPSAVTAALASTPELESVEVVHDLDGHALFRVEWNESVKGIVTAIATTELALLSAIGRQDRWVFEFRTDDVAELSAFQEYCREHDIEVTLTRLRSLPEIRTGKEYDLTPGQREALQLAFENGYYDDPRRTDLEALASKLDVSRPSVSDRLRRGYRNLIRNTIGNRTRKRRNEKR